MAVQRQTNAMSTRAKRKQASTPNYARKKETNKMEETKKGKWKKRGQRNTGGGEEELRRKQ